MADHVKSRREGDRVYFVINRHITPTNVCVLSCAFCGFARKPGEAGPERWCEIHGIAHALGIKTNATMLYGHVETLAERVEHLLRLREQQDASGGFVTFIPLAYQTAATKLVARQTPPADSLKTI